jgi:hypothetical protein
MITLNFRGMIILNIVNAKMVSLFIPEIICKKVTFKREVKNKESIRKPRTKKFNGRILSKGAKE